MVNQVIKRTKELGTIWPLNDGQTDGVLAEKLFSKTGKEATKIKQMPDFSKIRKEIIKSGITKKLLWTEYMEE